LSNPHISVSFARAAAINFTRERPGARPINRCPACRPPVVSYTAVRLWGGGEAASVYETMIVHPTLGSLSEGLLQSVAWPLVWLIAVQRTGQGNRCARTAPSPSAAQGPYPPDCPLQVLSSHAHCSATRPAVSTSGFNREASGVRVVVLLPPLCELPLTG